MITPFAFWAEPTPFAPTPGATFGRIFAARFVTTDTRPFYSDTEFATYLTASTTGITNQGSFMNTICWSDDNDRWIMTGAGLAQSVRLAYSVDGSNGASFSYAADPLNVISGNSRRYAAIWAGGSFNRFLVGGFNNIIQSATGASFSTFVNRASDIKSYPVNGGGYNGGMYYNSSKDHLLIWYGDAAASTSNITVCTMSVGNPTFSQATHLSSTITSIVWVSAAVEPYYHCLAAYTTTTASAITSTDGLNWTYRGAMGTIIPVSGAAPKHCYSPDLDRLLFYFTSGNTYTQPFLVGTGSAGPTFSMTTNLTRNVAMASNDYGITEAMWCKEISKFVAVDNRNAQVYTSADGFTWTIRVVAANVVGVGFAPGVQ